MVFFSLSFHPPTFLIVYNAHQRHAKLQRNTARNGAEPTHGNSKIQHDHPLTQSRDEVGRILSKRRNMCRLVVRLSRDIDDDERLPRIHSHAKEVMPSH